MTLRRLAVLGALLIELRDWLEDQDGQVTVDSCILDYAVDIAARAYQSLVKDGGR